MGHQIKKKSVTFSLTDSEREELLGRVAHHGFDDRNQYLLALMDVEKKLRLETIFDKAERRLYFKLDRFSKAGASSAAAKT